MSRLTASIIIVVAIALSLVGGWLIGLGTG